MQYTHFDGLGRPQRLSRLFPNKTEAKTFLQDLRRGTKIEAAREKKELTLGDWFDWLAENDWPESLDEKTIATRLARFTKYVRSELGGVPLTKLDPLVIRSFYRRLKNEGVGQPTLHALKANLVRVFNQAITPYGRVPMTFANPFRLVIQQAEPRDAVALTPEEARSALTCEKLCDAERSQLAVFLLSGLRLSEQMALTCGQINFRDHLILVDRAVLIAPSGKQRVGLPKSNKTRLAVMCPTLERILSVYVADMPPEAFLWPCKDGNWPKMKKRTYDSWKEIVAACKLPETMSPHDCRLSHINWIEKLMPSVSATTLKGHVGHAGVGVTEINYTWPLTPAQDLLRKELERLVGIRQKVRLAS